ncbi:transcriptional regulator [Raoultella planticola]|uniref:Transcriptional regulator n=1 Tax=Raoultella planticola TaxID=575 RepID=A0A5P6A911_RAOPL|nr:transcriptional regulator [Raoultella planticola]QFG76389.1 transcriptional regulator [Raoultella planticola]
MQPHCRFDSDYCHNDYFNHCHFDSNQFKQNT